tara:strand:+ start:1548 stop:1946 length:399 start_codon:yes stop_codon:yes gene_type:complete
MKTFYSIFIVLSFLITGCGKSEVSVVQPEDKWGKPCNVKVVITGKAPEVQFVLFTKAREKAITIDREINVLDETKDEFSFSSYTGGKLFCELKTKDSYGPEVSLKVFVNGKFWKEKSGKYNPNIEGVIPSDF